MNGRKRIENANVDVKFFMKAFSRNTKWSFSRNAIESTAPNNKFGQEMRFRSGVSGGSRCMGGGCGIIDMQNLYTDTPYMEP